MKKFDVLFIVLILAMPVFAANSNMVSDFGATSVAPALNDITWGTSVSYAQEGRSILVDVPFASPSIAAYAADFSAATADVAPN
ncbi:MAG: hypothetical protein NTW67_05695 [Candidatus Woesearchaeota archaeon]|nr:hypothetical protein [Candidatus Woesearchaeota archaeon]